MKGLKRFGKQIMVALLLVALNINPIGSLAYVVYESGIIDRASNLGKRVYAISTGTFDDVMAANADGSGTSSGPSTTVVNVTCSCDHQEIPISGGAVIVRDPITGEHTKMTIDKLTDLNQNTINQTVMTEGKLTEISANLDQLIEEVISTRVSMMEGFDRVEKQLIEANEKLDVILSSLHHYRVAHIYSLNNAFESALYRPYSKDVPYVEDFVTVTGQFANVYSGYWDANVTNLVNPYPASRALEVLGYDVLLRAEGVEVLHPNVLAKDNSKMEDSPDSVGGESTMSKAHEFKHIPTQEELQKYNELPDELKEVYGIHPENNSVTPNGNNIRLVQEFIPENNITWLDAVTVLYKALGQEVYTYQSFYTRNRNITPENSPLSQKLSGVKEFDGYDYFVFTTRGNLITGDGHNKRTDYLYWIKAIDDGIVNWENRDKVITAHEFYSLAANLMETYGEPVMNDDEIKALLQVYGDEYPVQLGTDIADDWAYLKARGVLSKDLNLDISSPMSRAQLLDICMRIKDKESREDYKTIQITLDIGDLMRDNGYYPVYDLDWDVGSFSTNTTIDYAEMENYTYLFSAPADLMLNTSGYGAIYSEPKFDESKIVAGASYDGRIEVDGKYFFQVSVPKTHRGNFYLGFTNLTDKAQRNGHNNFIELTSKNLGGGIYTSYYVKDGIATIEDKQLGKNFYYFNHRPQDKALRLFADIDRCNVEEKELAKFTSGISVNANFFAKAINFIDEMTSPLIVEAAIPGETDYGTNKPVKKDVQVIAQTPYIKPDTGTGIGGNDKPIKTESTPTYTHSTATNPYISNTSKEDDKTTTGTQSNKTENSTGTQNTTGNNSNKTENSTGNNSNKNNNSTSGSSGTSDYTTPNAGNIIMNSGDNVDNRNETTEKDKAEAIKKEQEALEQQNSVTTSNQTSASGSLQDDAAIKAGAQLVKDIEYKNGGKVVEYGKSDFALIKDINGVNVRKDGKEIYVPTIPFATTLSRFVTVKRSYPNSSSTDSTFAIKAFSEVGSTPGWWVSYGLGLGSQALTSDLNSNLDMQLQSSYGTDSAEFDTIVANVPKINVVGPKLQNDKLTYTISAKDENTINTAVDALFGSAKSTGTDVKDGTEDAWEDLEYDVATDTIMSRDENLLLSWSALKEAGLAWSIDKSHDSYDYDSKNGTYSFMTSCGSVLINETYQFMQVGTTLYTFQNGDKPANLVYVDPNLSETGYQEVYFDVRCVLGMVNRKFEAIGSTEVVEQTKVASLAIGEDATYSLNPDQFVGLGNETLFNQKIAGLYNFPELPGNTNFHGNIKPYNVNLINWTQYDGQEVGEGKYWDSGKTPTDGEQTFVPVDGSRISMSHFNPIANYMLCISDTGGSDIGVNGIQASVFVYYPRSVFTEGIDDNGDGVIDGPIDGSNWKQYFLSQLSVAEYNLSQSQYASNKGTVWNSIANYCGYSSADELQNAEWYDIATAAALLDLMAFTGRIYIEKDFVIREFDVTSNMLAGVSKSQSLAESPGEEVISPNEPGYCYWVPNIGYVYNLPKTDEFTLKDYYEGKYMLPLAVNTLGVISYNLNNYVSYTDKSGTEHSVPIGWELTDAGYQHYKSDGSIGSGPVASGDSVDTSKTPFDVGKFIPAPVGVYSRYGIWRQDNMHTISAENLTSAYTDSEAVYYGSRRVYAADSSPDNGVYAFKYGCTSYNPIGISGDTKAYICMQSRTQGGSKFAAYVMPRTEMIEGVGDVLSSIKEIPIHSESDVDWSGKVQLENMLNKVDNATNIFMIIIFTYAPMVCVMCMTIAVGLSFLTDSKIFLKFSDNVIDLVQVFTLGIKDAHHWNWRKVLIPCMCTYIAFALFMNANILKIIIWVVDAWVRITSYIHF